MAFIKINQAWNFADKGYSKKRSSLLTEIVFNFGVIKKNNWKSRLKYINSSTISSGTNTVR